MSIKQVRQAAKLCDICPVAEQCLRWALTNREEYGVWAGTSGRVRRKIFSAIDKGSLTVDDVIEVFKHERSRVSGLGSDQETPKAAQARGAGIGRTGGLPSDGGVQVVPGRALNG